MVHKTCAEKRPSYIVVDADFGESQDTSKRTEAQTLLPHHTHQPTKSVLRHPADRNKRKRSIQYAPDGDLKTEVTIPSYKSLGEGLWFQCPGSLVNCDHCNRLVPQAMGSLQVGLTE
eukprot:g27549.t1